MAAGDRVKSGDGTNDLLERIAGDPAFASVAGNLGELTDAGRLVGRSADQVDELLDGPVSAALDGRKDEEEAEEKIEV